MTIKIQDCHWQKQCNGGLSSNHPTRNYVRREGTGKQQENGMGTSRRTEDSMKVVGLDGSLGNIMVA